MTTTTRPPLAMSAQEARNLVATLSTRVAELEGALARTEANRDACMQDANEEYARAERAEAALATAMDDALRVVRRFTDKITAEDIEEALAQQEGAKG